MFRKIPSPQPDGRPCLSQSKSGSISAPLWPQDWHTNRCWRSASWASSGQSSGTSFAKWPQAVQQIVTPRTPDLRIAPSVSSSPGLTKCLPHVSDRSSVSRQLSPSPMMVFAIGVKYPFDVPVQRPHEADALAVSRRRVFGCRLEPFATSPDLSVAGGFVSPLPNLARLWQC